MSDPKLPAKYDPTRKPDADHQVREWTSGRRGGGKVPADFGWNTNPKQWQEENGVNAPVGEVKKKQ